MRRRRQVMWYSRMARLYSSVGADCEIAIGPCDKGKAAKRETSAGGRRPHVYLTRGRGSGQSLFLSGCDEATSEREPGANCVALIPVPYAAASGSAQAPRSSPRSPRWPWLFALNLPLGGMVLLATRALPAPAGTARRLDRFSVALNVGALALLVVGAELLVANPALAAGLLAAAALGLAALVWRELPKAVPLIPLDLLRATSFRTSVIASACCFAGMTMGLLALPFYLQHGLGQDTLMTGLYMTPWPLMVAIVAPVAGRLADRTSTGWLCAAGGGLPGDRAGGRLTVAAARSPAAARPVHHLVRPGIRPLPGA